MFGFLKVDKFTMGAMGLITACTVAERVLEDRAMARQSNAAALNEARNKQQAIHDMLLKERAVIVKAMGLKAMSNDPSSMTDNEWLELARRHV